RVDKAGYHGGYSAGGRRIPCRLMELDTQTIQIPILTFPRKRLRGEGEIKEMRISKVLANGRIKCDM
ncbi:MAG: hypothetical protein WA005_00205, partial [Candidatus Binataceae bacterium]